MTDPKPRGVSVEYGPDELDDALRAAVYGRMLDSGLADQISDIIHEHAALKAEVEKIKAGADQWMAKFAETAKGLTEERDAAHSREALSAKAYGNLCSERDKLKAELERLNDRHKIDMMELDAASKAEAKLARWQPLIEAVPGPGEGEIEWDGRYTTKAAGDILRAALSCRESPESDIVSRGKDDILGERKGKP